MDEISPGISPQARGRVPFCSGGRSSVLQKQGSDIHYSPWKNSFSLSATDFILLGDSRTALARKLTADELLKFIAGKSMPPEFDREPVVSVPFVNRSAHEFRILERVGKARKVGRNFVTRCPSCAEANHDHGADNLAISIQDPRKYICWAGCTKEMIRRAVGCPIPARS
jgi:hypothetical protein